MVGDFHKLDRFGEIVFGDEKGQVPSSAKADVAKGDKGDKAEKKDDKQDKKDEKAAKGEKPAKKDPKKTEKK
jgi:hypothetical protein